MLTFSLLSQINLHRNICRGKPPAQRIRLLANLSHRAEHTGTLGAVRSRLFTAENRKWWTLAAVAVGLFMIMLDNTVVNVALPSIQEDLGMSPSELSGCSTPMRSRSASCFSAAASLPICSVAG